MSRFDRLDPACDPAYTNGLAPARDDDREPDVICPSCGYTSFDTGEFVATFCPSWPDRCSGCEIHEDRRICPQCDHAWALTERKAVGF